MDIKKDVLQNSVDYSMDAIKHICKNMPPREPGSKGERECQEYLKNEIEKNAWADETVIEEFQVAPKAFMSFSKIIPICILIGLVLFALTGAGIASLEWAPLAMCVIALTTLIGEFLLYKEFLDPYFKKVTSSNLTAVKKATEETQRRIIFCGHTDAAYEWRIFNFFGAKVFIGSLVGAFIGALTTIALSIAAICTGFKWWYFIVMLCFIPGYVSLFLFTNYKRIVPGANDNLTGTLASVSVLKYLKESGISYKNTDVAAVLTGSEEAGLRGAKAWAKAHKAECDKLPTMFISVDTLRDIDHLSNCIRDLTLTVKHSDEGIKLIDDAATALFGKPLPHASVFLGASDSAAITQAGITAGGLIGMDPAPAAYYHTRKDTEDNLDPVCFSKGLEIMIKAADIYSGE